MNHSRWIFFLGTKSNTTIKAIPLENGPVHVEFRIIRNVMASATEAEMGGLFENCQKATSMRMALAKMFHPQPPTPVETENTAENSVINGIERKKKI